MTRKYNSKSQVLSFFPSVLLQELITPISIREDMGPLQASILLSGTGELIDDLPVMVSTQSVSATCKSACLKNSLSVFAVEKQPLHTT